MKLNRGISLLLAGALAGSPAIDWGQDIIGGTRPHSYRLIKHYSQSKRRRLAKRRG